VDALAQEAAEALQAFVQRLPNGVLGLPAGRTPLPVYARWTQRQAPSAMELGELRIFGLDELAVAPGQRGPFRLQLEEQVAVPLRLRSEQLHTFPVEDKDPAGFDTELQAAGGLDLVLLGIGVNGHLAFNEPAASLQAKAHRVTLSAESRAASAWLFPGGPGEVPQEALTLGMASLLQAREVWLLAVGKEKAAAVARMLRGPVTPECPASFLQLHSRCTVWADAEAASG
jgi:glucosamine-6-phosphate deaminase